MRPIDADALIHHFYETEYASMYYIEVVKRIIDEQPTLSPDDVRGVGEWISERDGSIVELDEDGYVTDSCHCSVCNEHLDGSEEYAVKGNYCPSCGARMKGAETSE